MKLGELFEAPFNDNQEEQFLKLIDRSKKYIYQYDDDTDVNHTYLTNLVTKIDPSAKKIGKGAFTVAFGRNNHSEIIKITGSQNMPLWYKWCMKNTSNPWCPRVHRIERIGGHIHYIRMERLSKVTKFVWNEEHLPFLATLVNHKGHVEPAVFERLGIQNADNSEEFKKRVLELYYDSNDFGVKAIEQITKIIGLRLNDATMDMMVSVSEASNIRMRGSQPVLLDPIIG